MIGINANSTDRLQATYDSLEKSMELLNEKQAQLVESEKRASLGLLVSGVAHELNNPLNNISLIAERMAEEREYLSAVKTYHSILSPRLDWLRLNHRKYL